jgi:hypothetical protein
MPWNARIINIGGCWLLNHGANIEHQDKNGEYQVMVEESQKQLISRQNGKFMCQMVPMVM